MTAASTTPYLEIEGLTVSYNQSIAVDAVDLSIARGETLCLLGPSGCGKTTILRSIAGLIEPEGGAIVLGGDDLISTPIHKRDIGLVFQTWALFPHMTVRENVSYGLKMRRVGKSERAERVQEVLELVKLEHLADRKPAQLSGGQQQRVALARAVVTRPRLLLLDEPLSSLDLKIRTELRRELRRIQQTLRLTAVYVTHDHSEALALGDRVAVMAVGRVIEVGPPEEIFASPRTAYVTDFLGFDNIVPARCLQRADASVEMLVSGRAIAVRRMPPSHSEVRYESIAISPWAVTPTATATGISGPVVSLDQQSGRILVSVQTEDLGIVNGFADPALIPQIGETVSLAVDWSRARALEAS